MTDSSPFRWVAYLVCLLWCETDTTVGGIGWNILGSVGRFSPRPTSIEKVIGGVICFLLGRPMAHKSCDNPFGQGIAHGRTGISGSPFS